MDDATEQAEVVVGCRELDPNLHFFTELGFSVRSVFPADDPETVVVQGRGLRVRLERTPEDRPVELVLTSPDLDPRQVVAPGGSRVRIIRRTDAVEVPSLQSALSITRAGPDATWVTGRAGMQYRDLVPDRQGGFVIASHIRIPDGGPVPDYVHFHRVYAQVIYCHRGWVKVVYEDQGPPFVMEAGDCVLQPPRIRHRVLESSKGLEVIEVGVPARHETLADPATLLPTAELRPDRDFSGQRFVRHRAAKATWEPWRIAGFVARDTGLAAATDGIIDVKVARPSGPASSEVVDQARGLQLDVVLAGTTWLMTHGKRHTLNADDAAVVPPGSSHAFVMSSDDFELLEVTVREPSATHGV